MGTKAGHAPPESPRPRAPVRVTRPDGTVETIPAAPSNAPGRAPLSVDSGSRIPVMRDMVASTVAARRRSTLLLVLGLAGVVGTVWSLTHPLEVLAWPIALLGLGAVIAAWWIARRDAATDPHDRSSIADPAQGGD